jgi:hypothetical protein
MFYTKNNIKKTQVFLSVGLRSHTIVLREAHQPSREIRAVNARLPSPESGSYYNMNCPSWNAGSLFAMTVFLLSSSSYCALICWHHVL